MSEILVHYANEFRSGRDVSPYDAEVLFDEIVSSTDEEALSSILAGWAKKGPTEDEIYRFAAILRSRMKAISTPKGAVLDIVGTGGAAPKTFNVSTAAAFVAAGAGVTVAKHGNRAATSRSGSADVLSALGVEPDADPSVSERDLAAIGLCFMYAPRHHKLSPVLARVRRRLGVPTIFNCIGPLANPAGARHLLIGVWTPVLVPKMANVLARLGAEHAWVVSGAGGLDEICLNGPTSVAEVRGNSVEHFTFEPADVGVEARDTSTYRTRTPAESAALISSILAGEMVSTPAEDLVLVNAAAAIYLAGRAASLTSAMKLARKSLRSGLAAQKLEQLAAACPAKPE